MAKTRPNRKRIAQMKKKQSFQVATQVRLLVEQLPNQAALSTFLNQEPDMTRRRALFAFCKPFVKFAGAVCPSPLDLDHRIIAP